MVIIGFLGVLSISFISFIKQRDLASPVFILSSIWVFIYFSLMLRMKNIEFLDIKYLLFFMSVLIFSLGFFLVVRNKKKLKNNKYVNIKINYRKRTNILVFISFCIFILYLLEIIPVFMNNFQYNFWQTINIAEREGLIKENILVSYGRNFIFSFFVLTYISYLIHPNKTNKNLFIYLLAIYSFFLIFGARGGMFWSVLIIGFGYLIINNSNNKKIFKLLVIMFISIILIFISFSFLKFVFDNQNSSFDFLLKYFRIYFTTPPLAFIQYLNTPLEMLFGQNTFRFFIAIFNSIGFDLNPPSGVQEFIYIYGDSTNVYTHLHYYTRDFGLIYAFIIQFLLGVLHGYFYLKVRISNKINLFQLSIFLFLYFPLIYQYFDDKYISIFSTWLQIFIWTYLISKIFMQVKKEK
jgi:oligosaccharide repeat unit polymerase